MIVLGPAFFFLFLSVSDRWLLYTDHFAQLVQLGPGVVATTNNSCMAGFNMQRPLQIGFTLVTIHSENAAYQLLSSRIRGMLDQLR